MIHFNIIHSSTSLSITTSHQYPTCIPLPPLLHLDGTNCT
jgi:hypothetical protein